MNAMKALAATALGAALVLVAAAPVQASSDASVGDFVMQLARTKNVNSADPAIAADALAAVGVRLPADLDFGRTLTEADVAHISRFAGLRVTTSQPRAAFTRLQVERFFHSFAAELGASTRECDPAVEDCSNPGQGLGPGNGESEPPFDPFTKGQGRAKGKAKQPVTPTAPI